MKWHPVRLGMRRVGANAWWISREGVVVGEVRFDDDLWIARKGHERVLEDGRNALLFDDFGGQRHGGFRAAVLSVARVRRLWASSDGPQDLGDVRALRVNVVGRWYTVLLRKDERYIYEDHTIKENLTDEEQAVLRRVLTEVDAWEWRSL